MLCVHYVVQSTYLMLHVQVDHFYCIHSRLMAPHCTLTMHGYGYEHSPPNRRDGQCRSCFPQEHVSPWNLSHLLWLTVANEHHKHRTQGYTIFNHNRSAHLATTPRFKQVSLPPESSLASTSSQVLLATCDG